MDNLATTQTIIQSVLKLSKSSIAELYEQISASIEPQTEDLKERLKKAYNSQDLIPVLGAGVSMTCGVPDWNVLLQKLLVESLENDTTSGTDQNRKNVLAYLFPLVSKKGPLIAARYLNRQFQSPDSPIALEKRVRALLYENLLDDPSRLVLALAKDVLDLPQEASMSFRIELAILDVF